MYTYSKYKETKSNESLIIDKGGNVMRCHEYDSTKYLKKNEEGSGQSLGPCLRINLFYKFMSFITR